MTTPTTSGPARLPGEISAPSTVERNFPGHHVAAGGYTYGLRDTGNELFISPAAGIEIYANALRRLGVPE